MAKCTINKQEFAFNNAVEMFKVIEKLSDCLKETFIMSLTTGYAVNVSGQRIAVIQYLRDCQNNKEVAEIYTSKDALQVIF